MFANTCSFERSDTDWEKTKEFAQNVVDYEIRLRIDANESVSDEEYYELCHQFWLNFYNSCVEYHIVSYIAVMLSFGSVCVDEDGLN